MSASGTCGRGFDTQAYSWTELRHAPLSGSLPRGGERLEVRTLFMWSRTPASIEDPQHAPRVAAQAQMAAAPPGLFLPLLPSGPDGCPGPDLRRSRPPTPVAAASDE